MRRYLQEIGLSGARLAERCGVSHSQVHIIVRDPNESFKGTVFGPDGGIDCFRGRLRASE